MCWMSFVGFQLKSALLWFTKGMAFCSVITSLPSAFCTVQFFTSCLLKGTAFIGASVSEPHTSTDTILPTLGLEMDHMLPFMQQLNARAVHVSVSHT